MCKHFIGDSNSLKGYPEDFFPHYFYFQIGLGCQTCCCHKNSGVENCVLIL